MLTMTYKGKRVLTTDQLATIFGTYVDSVYKNYHVNKDRFEEGQHFYTLKGEELKAFKAALSNYLTESKVVANRSVNVVHSAVELLEAPDDAAMYVPAPKLDKRAAHLTLWTRRGMARHAKMLTTEQAWQLYERMEDVYFAVLEGKRQEAPKAKTAPTIKYKSWRGRAVLTTRDMLELIPGATKDHIRYVVETDLTSADTVVLEGARLKQFKRENGLRKMGKSLRVLYESGVKKVCAFYNVAVPALEETPTPEEKPPLETQQMTLFEAPPPGVDKFADRLLSSAKTMLDVGEFLTAVGNELKAKVG